MDEDVPRRRRGRVQHRVRQDGERFGGGRRMTVLERLAATIAELLVDDARRVLLGEDVRDGGMLGLSLAAMGDPNLRDRVAAIPLSPTAMWAHAAGLAAGGRRPIVLCAAASALFEGFAGLREAAHLGWRSGDQRPVPLLIVAPEGPGFGLGTEHASVPESVLTGITGLRVVVAGRTEELAAYLRAAANFDAGDQPTVLLLPRTLLLREAPTSTPLTLDHRFGSAHVLTGGDDLTVFTWGSTVETVLDAVRETAADATIVDVSTLGPLDTDTLVDAANRTGRLLIAHAGPAAFGVGAEIAALTADRSIYHLDAPVTRVTGQPGPYAPGREESALPSRADLVAAIQALIPHPRRPSPGRSR
ncbi:MAG: hypothetical protein B7733_00305 [Myxococcales bacterium FL481]|nr:MAG: hypothetical protein B7733_00305 [Myxococcales bacterium FL481]